MVINSKTSQSEPNYFRNTNKHTVLDLVRFTPGGISRAELARQMNLSRAAITALVNDLLQSKLVHEVESGPGTGGRRSILLEINPERGFVVGIDIGATHITLVLADMAARVIHELEEPFDVALGPQVGLEAADRALRRLISEAGLALEDILTVGVGIPGPVSGESSMVIAPPIMPGWDRYPIRSELQTRWGRPVSLNNDAELGALGEWAYGAGRDESNLAYIKVGSGIGAGLLLNNRIYRGSNGTAGEIGHMTIQPEGPLCTCGNRGCLEALAGGRAIASLAQEEVRSGQRTRLSAIHPVEKITAQDVVYAARRGDLAAQKIISEAGAHLGTAIASLINLINPGIVVVGGGVAQTGDLLLEPIRQTVRERSLKAAVEGVRITSAVLGRRSSSMGAVVQALSVVLHQFVDHPPLETTPILERR